MGYDHSEYLVPVNVRFLSGWWAQVLFFIPCERWALSSLSSWIILDQLWFPHQYSAGIRKGDLLCSSLFAGPLAWEFQPPWFYWTRLHFLKSGGQATVKFGLASPPCAMLEAFRAEGGGLHRAHLTWFSFVRHQFFIV